jgi:hypothetical protein
MQESDKNQFGLQDSNVSCLDLGLCLKGHDDNLDSVGQNTENQMKSASIDVEFLLKTN